MRKQASEARQFWQYDPLDIILLIDTALGGVYFIFMSGVDRRRFAQFLYDWFSRLCSGSDGRFRLGRSIADTVNDFSIRRCGMDEMSLYMVYDRVAEVAGPVFEARNDGVAMRQYRNLMKDAAEVDRESYWLYRVGSVDHKAMKIVAEEPLRIEAPEAVDVER